MIILCSYLFSINLVKSFQFLPQYIGTPSMIRFPIFCVIDDLSKKRISILLLWLLFFSGKNVSFIVIHHYLWTTKGLEMILSSSATVVFFSILRKRKNYGLRVLLLYFFDSSLCEKLMVVQLIETGIESLI